MVILLEPLPELLIKIQALYRRRSGNTPTLLIGSQKTLRLSHVLIISLPIIQEQTSVRYTIHVVIITVIHYVFSAKNIDALMFASYMSLVNALSCPNHHMYAMAVIRVPTVTWSI